MSDEPRQASAFLVFLKSPVRLPCSLLDAMRTAGVEKIEALDEKLTKAALVATDKPGIPF